MRTAFRFCFGSPDGPHCGLWKLLAQNGQAYLSSGSPGPGVKISFHADGRCHYGNRELEKLGVSPHLDVWRWPHDSTGQLAIPFRLFTPAGEAEVAPIRTTPSKPIEWIPLPSEGAVAEVTFVLSHRLPSGDWPGKADGMKPLIRLDLAPDRFYWAVWRLNQEILVNRCDSG